MDERVTQKWTDPGIIIASQNEMFALKPNCVNQPLPQSESEAVLLAGTFESRPGL